MNHAAAKCIYRGDRDLDGLRVGVLGLARTGAACVRFLAGRGARVTALDARPLADLSPECREAARMAERVIAPCAGPADCPPADMLVISPGVPTDAPIVRAAREAGAEVIGEIELAYRFLDAPLLAVTGTCGKGTTVTAMGALLDAAAIAHTVAGNIGLPLIGEVEASANLAVAVAEISSYQLETTEHFHPHIAALLNITEDHQERYGSFADYAEAKHTIFRNQTEEDWAIVCVDDAEARRAIGRTRARTLTVGLHDPHADARLEGTTLTVQLPGHAPEAVAMRDDLALAGDHHVINFLTACLAARLCGAPASEMAQALRGYRPAPHLMEIVGELDGVRYIDDSKATNPASAIADLRSIGGPVIVIAGGKEKNTSFAEFGEMLRRRAKRVILMGECARRIEEAVGATELCRRVETIEEAVAEAASVARPGDTVALCPGCSSLDQFASYAQRGAMFRAALEQRAIDSQGA